MYKALIIDDEIEAIESVYSAFDWNSLHVTEVVKISNPHGLVERMVSESPEIVFIDIEMGVVSGLDVIEACSKLLPETRFVIISGHDNFEYARTSIRLDVVYYLLKPFTEYEVDIATEKLMNDLNVRFGGETGVQLNDINSFLSNKQQFQDFMLESGIIFPQSYRFIVACMEKVDLESLSLCLQDQLIKRYKIGSKKYLLVVEEPLSENSMILLENLSCISNMTLGISDIISTPGETYACFKQANMLAYGTFIHERFGIYKTERDGEDVFNNLMDMLEAHFEAENFDALQEMLTVLPKQSRDKKFNMEQIVFFHNSFIIRLNTVLRQRNKKDFLYILSFEELLNEYSDLQSMCDTLKEALCAVNDSNPESADEKPKINSVEVVEQVKQYLKVNYVQKIRIKDLSTMFYISEAYLSDIFKTLTHKTIIEYLADVRIEAAKESLKNTRMNISNIAESVGYGDYCYFNKIFKKYVGVTPYQYRKKYAGNVENED
ncbi:MAG: helix-turn-helix domain-containing protein [Clostridia bacterium]|nr:helix-turn-helix domain-containing protein [Clostridia bacterium]